MLIDLLSVSFRALCNTFTLVIVILSTALWLVGLQGDALFLLSTITVNAIIGIIQEVRAKATLRSLALLHAPTASLIRGDITLSIPVSEVTVGDHLTLNRGDQIPADGILLKSHNLFVNEALLTGESEEQEFHLHHPVYAGSFVVSGSAIMRVTAIGEHTRAGQMSTELKWYQAKLTPLQKTIGRIIRVLSYLAICVGILIYIDGSRSQEAITSILSLIASGAISLVPEGLLLASTLLFAYGAIKMSKEKVLIQNLGAVEGLSRLTILCLDKTGTITENSLSLKEAALQAPYTKLELQLMLGAFLSTDEPLSPTMAALTAYIPKDPIELLDSIPFSSSRKFSALLYADESLQRALSLGAPEVLRDYCHLTEKHLAFIASEASQGNRVLMLVDHGMTRNALSVAITKPGHPVAFLVLKHTLRPDAEDSIFYLQAQGVAIKIISGDSKETVQAIARRAGIRNWRACITGDQLAELTPEEWKHRIPLTTIFARVLPEQKKLIIQTLQSNDFVGMIGDGVNDTLALKQANVSIAMQEGSPAAALVSDVVLLNNSFGSIPVGMRLGSQIVLGIQMVSCLFFNKIAVGSTALILSYLLDLPYPFSTRYLFLINIFTVGLPTLLWSLAPAKPSIRQTTDQWLYPVLKFCALNGLISGLAIMTGLYSSTLLPQHDHSTQTVALYIALVLGLLTVWLIPRHFKAINNDNVRWYPLIYTALALVAIFFGGRGEFIGDLFLIARLTPSHLLIIITTSLMAGMAMWSLTSTRKHFVTG